MKISSLAQLLALALTLGSGLAAHTAHAAALPPRVSVVFIEPDKFTDVRYSEAERSSRALLLQLQRFIVDTAAGICPNRCAWRSRSPTLTWPATSR